MGIGGGALLTVDLLFLAATAARPDGQLIMIGQLLTREILWRAEPDAAGRPTVHRG